MAIKETVAKAKEDTVAPVKENQKLIQARFSEASFKRNIWFCEAAHGVTLLQVAQPEYWANVAHQLTAKDRIEVYAEDGTYYAEFMVRQVPEKSVTRPINWARVTLMRHVDLTKDTKNKEDVALPEDFEVCFVNPTAKWGVRRKADSTVLVDKQESAGAAVAAFRELHKTMAA